MPKDKLVPLLVTTLHRGVFFGYGEPTNAKIIRLERVQMCVYWSADVRGALGLAVTGPTKGCRVGPPAPFMVIQDVTACIGVSEEAAKKWEGQPWN